MSKLNVCVSHTLIEKNEEDCISILTNLLSKQENDVFLKSLQVTKNGSFMTIQHKRLWIDKDEFLQATQGGSFMEVKLCVYSGITTVLFILSF